MKLTQNAVVLNSQHSQADSQKNSSGISNLNLNLNHHIDTFKLLKIEYAPTKYLKT